MKNHFSSSEGNKPCGLLKRLAYQLYHNVLPTLLILVTVCWVALIATNTIVTAKNAQSKGISALSVR